MKSVEISSKGRVLTKARLCNTFLSETRGYMFRRPSGSFLFELPWESRILAGIHLFFVFFPLQAIWLNDQLIVVDVKAANPWTLSWPKSGAKYLIETPAQNPLPVETGQKLELISSD